MEYFLLFARIFLFLLQRFVTYQVNIFADDLHFPLCAFHAALA